MGGVALLYAAFVHAAGFNLPIQLLWGGLIFGAATSLLPWLLLMSVLTGVISALEITFFDWVAGCLRSIAV